MIEPDVLLLSGMGPTGLSGGDLVGTRFDRRFTDTQIRDMYTLNNVCYDPVNLTYNGRAVFRKNYRKSGALVTRVLESILERHDVHFTSMNLGTVWNCEKPTHPIAAKIVCLSTTFMWSGHMLDMAIEWIRSNVSFSYLILGGKYASLKREKLLRQYPEIDFIIVGDGETALPALIDHLLCRDPDLAAIPNLLYRQDNAFVTHPIQEEDLEHLEITGYNGAQDIVMYESVRGCVFHCKFCAWSVGVERFRSKSAEKILSEWRTYTRQNSAAEIQVIDSTFFIPRQRMDTLLKELPALGIRWKANARTDIPVTEEYVAQLERSGCVSLKFGFESMSDTVLGYIDKRSTSANNRRVNRCFRNSSIDTIVSFIVGFPGETPEEFARTEEFILEELFGHFHLYVFELEDECMPIWREREKYQLQIYGDEYSSARPWEHGGLSWSHCGMDSGYAEQLKKQLLTKLRKSENLAVHRTWQGGFESPLLPDASRHENIRAEKLLDRLVYLPADYDVHSQAYNDRLLELVRELEACGFAWAKTSC